GLQEPGEPRRGDADAERVFAMLGAQAHDARGRGRDRGTLGRGRDAGPVGRSRRHAFSPPAVSPRITRWLRMRYSTSAGSTVMLTAANVGPHSIWPYWPVKLRRPVWIVRLESLLMNVSESSRSFQMKKNWTSATVNTALLSIGTATRKNAW